MMTTTTSTLAPTPKRAARAPRRFTAVHKLPSGHAPDVANLLVQFFGPALVQATQSPTPATASAQNSAVVSLVSTNLR